jgi:thiopeptide-type bacteriocin biosynthesis protein
MTTAKPAATPVGQVADAVRAVLAGEALPEVAARTGLPAADLQAALAVYHAGGKRAVETRSAGRWHAVRIVFADRAQAETTMATIVAPVLDTLCASRRSVGWWFRREPHAWRIYLHNPDLATAGQAIRRLGRTGTVAATVPEPYTLDPQPFGGLSGAAIAQDLFVVESRAVLGYARFADPPLGRRELSVAVLDTLMVAARLAWAARGDVYTRLAATHPNVDPAGARRLGAELLASLTDPALDLAAASTAAWTDGCAAAGKRLADATDNGLLTRRLVDVLATIVNAQWNRLGMPATTQAVLAHAATHLYSS